LIIDDILIGMISEDSER